jgi:hypothetical protein
MKRSELKKLILESIQELKEEDVDSRDSWDPQEAAPGILRYIAEAREIIDHIEESWENGADDPLYYTTLKKFVDNLRDYV